MSLTLDLKRTAVLAMDFQNDIVAGTAALEERRILKNVARMLDECRRKAVPVIYITVSFRPDYLDAPAQSPLFQGAKKEGYLKAGSTGARIHPAVAPRDNEPVLNETCVNPFLSTGLSAVLNNFNANTILLMGLWTNFVVEATTRHAADTGYRVVVVEDCCASNTQENHTFAIDNILPNFATIAGMDDVLKLLA